MGYGAIVSANCRILWSKGTMGVLGMAHIGQWKLAWSGVSLFIELNGGICHYSISWLVRMRLPWNWLFIPIVLWHNGSHNSCNPNCKSIATVSSFFNIMNFILAKPRLFLSSSPQILPFLGSNWQNIHLLALTGPYPAVYLFARIKYTPLYSHIRHEKMQNIWFAKGQKG